MRQTKMEKLPHQVNWNVFDKFTCAKGFKFCKHCAFKCDTIQFWESRQLVFTGELKLFLNVLNITFLTLSRKKIAGI